MIKQDVKQNLEVAGYSTLKDTCGTNRVAIVEPKGLVFDEIQDENGIVVLHDNKWKKVPESFFGYVGNVRKTYSDDILVTPELAKFILEHCNVKNRTPSSSKIDLYASYMNRGVWKLTHQGIGFYENGVLADSGHRLAAIVKSGKSVVMKVTFGIPLDAAIFIDNVKPRTLSDQSEIVGGKMPSNLVQIGSTLITCGYKLEVDGADKRLEAYERIKDGLINGARLKKKKGFSTFCKVSQAVAARLFYNVDRYSDTGGMSRFDELVNVFNTEEMPNGMEDNAIIKLIKFAVKSENTDGFKSYYYWYGRIEKCFHHFMLRETIGQVREENYEMFPLPSEIE